MSVDAHVPSRPAQTLPFPVRDVLLRLRVSILLCHTEVDDVDEVSVLRPRSADEKVIRLDVPVDEVRVMDSLHARYLGSIAHTMIRCATSRRWARDGALWASCR